jgi:hypothetical protein
METTWTKERMFKLLDSNHAAVERALVVLLERQTPDEQVTHSTHHLNAEGFSAAHSGRGTTYAKWVLHGLSQGLKYGQCIKSSLHKELARRLVKHYWKQLIQEAEAKALKR